MIKMKGRIRVLNPKELSQTAKVLGLSTSDFLAISVFYMVSPILNMNGILKIIIPFILIAINKYINRKHPATIYVALLKKTKILRWAGATREIRK